MTDSTNEQPKNVSKLATFANRAGLKFNEAAPAPKPNVVDPDAIVTHCIMSGLGNMYFFGTQEEIVALLNVPPETLVRAECVAKEDKREPMWFHAEDLRFILKSQPHQTFWDEAWKDEAERARSQGRGTPPRVS